MSCIRRAAPRLESEVLQRCLLSLTPLVAGAVFLSLLPRAHAWEMNFGGCTFSGPDDGGALVRSGSCSEEGGGLDLSIKGITTVPADAFADMDSLT